jgi:hypothetical protein
VVLFSGMGVHTRQALGTALVTHYVLGWHPLGVPHYMH